MFRLWSSCFRGFERHEHTLALQDGPAAADALSRAIIETEEQSQMTLMHRFNKAADLLDQVMKVRALNWN